MLLDKVKTVNLIKYLPVFMHEYKEIKTITDCENPIIQDECLRLKQAFRNNFIFLTDETGIAIFEKMMKIYPPSNASLASRQAAVFTKWNSSLPYTWEWLLEFLENYFSNSNTIATPILYNLIYGLDIELVKEEGFTDFEYALFTYLREVIPANLVLNIINIKESSGTYYLGNLETQILEEEYYPDGEDTEWDNRYYMKNLEIQIIEEVIINGI